MKKFLMPLGFLVLGGAAFANPCLPGNLQDYYNLGSTGCSQGDVQFVNFTSVPGIFGATPINPSLVQVTPFGGSTPSLLFTLNSTATDGELLESIFRFAVIGSVFEGFIGLSSPSASGDGAVTGILDLCSDGFFAGTQPSGCPTSSATAIAFAIDGDQGLSDSKTLPLSSFFDVFVDLTVDGGPAGSATLDSATVAFSAVSAVPEPSTAVLIAASFGIMALIRKRRRQ